MRLTDFYAARTGEAGLERDPAQEAVVERLEALRAALADPGGLRRWLRPAPQVRGVYLWGSVGRGKSMLLEMLLETLGGIPRRRLHFHAFMQEVHAALHRARAAAADDPIAAATDAIAGDTRLLALDEVEVTDVVDATIVGRVFERLLARNVVPVATANRPPGELYRDGLKRELFLPFVRLLEAQLDVLELPGRDDYRRRAGPDETVFFVPCDAEAEARMDALWREVTSGSEGALALGHGARVRTAGDDGAARASFEDLCDHPLGAADYLRLVERVSLLFLDRIPRLGEARYDAARRFVTLVDVLYEARSGLVASAEDVPERLYPAGEGAFEFRRTASRLAEMQTPGWPGKTALDLRRRSIR